MTRASRTVGLHETTVRTAETHAKRQNGRKPAAPPAPRASAVQIVRPNPIAWAAALELAGGDPKRLEVISPTVVVVR